MERVITQESLGSVLDYNSGTGVFTWKISPSNNVKIGDVAGSMDKRGYIRISINKKGYLAHRLAWLYVYGKFPNGDLDHKNQIASDNSILNLREASSEDNSKNLPKYSNNKSGTSGVYLDKRRGTWYSQIQYEGTSIYLGGFKDKRLAIEARKYAEIKYGYSSNHGEDTVEMILSK